MRLSHCLTDRIMPLQFLSPTHVMSARFELRISMALRCAIFYAGISLSLVGCATPGELANKAPQIVFESVRSPKDFSACVSREWSKETAYISTLVMEDGYMVSLLHSHAGADASVTIARRGEGSYIRYAERMPSFSPDWMKQAVVKCK